MRTLNNNTNSEDTGEAKTEAERQSAAAQKPDADVRRPDDEDPAMPLQGFAIGEY
jgi:hypothetical protein